MNYFRRSTAGMPYDAALRMMPIPAFSEQTTDVGNQPTQLGTKICRRMRKELAVGALADSVARAFEDAALLRGAVVILPADGALLDGDDTALTDVPPHCVVGGLP